jgi:CDP-4-dehydro-6-deoxyglucose reductase, E3
MVDHPLMASFSAELVERVPLSPRVVGLTFVASEAFSRAAGQYVLLTLDEGTSHAFSVASPYEPAAPGRFEIAVARGTTAEGLLAVPLGGVVSATGPSGSLVWKGDAPALLVGTGTGISPLRALVKEQLGTAATDPLVLLFGCRDQSEELWGAELRELSRQHPRLRFFPSYSQPATSSADRAGRVQAYLPALVSELGAGLRAYLCGHTPMVNDCTALLLEAGVSAERIHGESY